MSDYAELEKTLKAKLVELTERAEIIEDDLRHALDDDLPDQAIDLADDEALAGVDEVLRKEIIEVRRALRRIADGTYGECANCGAEISQGRLEALPTATLCIKCA